MAREVAEARARGVVVSPASVTVCFVLADLIDEAERTNSNPYLIPQVTSRLLEERRAAHLLPDAVEPADDPVERAITDFFADLKDPYS